MAKNTKTVVLVADDEPSTRALVAGHLRAKGYKVIEASDGDEAWELAHEHLPHAVVLDVMMPGMSGWEVCRKIREAVSLAHTGVVMLTGIGENLNELTSPLYGADAYVDKPFEFGVLDQRLRETLARRGGGTIGRPDAADQEPAVKANGQRGRKSVPAPALAAPKRAAKKAPAKTATPATAKAKAAPAKAKPKAAAPVKAKPKAAAPVKAKPKAAASVKAKAKAKAKAAPPAKAKAKAAPPAKAKPAKAKAKAKAKVAAAKLKSKLKTTAPAKAKTNAKAHKAKAAAPVKTRAAQPPRAPAKTSKSKSKLVKAMAQAKSKASKAIAKVRARAKSARVTRANKPGATI